MLDLNLQALQENAATNPGVQQMHSVILALMNRLNVMLHPALDATDGRETTNDGIEIIR